MCIRDSPYPFQSSFDDHRHFIFKEVPCTLLSFCLHMVTFCSVDACWVSTMKITYRFRIVLFTCFSLFAFVVLFVIFCFFLVCLQCVAMGTRWYFYQHTALSFPQTLCGVRRSIGTWGHGVSSHPASPTYLDVRYVHCLCTGDLYVVFFTVCALLV